VDRANLVRPAWDLPGIDAAAGRGQLGGVRDGREADRPATAFIRNHLAGMLDAL
jgi:hypothetical protein